MGAFSGYPLLVLAACLGQPSHRNTNTTTDNTIISVSKAAVGYTLLSGAQ
jgi:hypothetical protein